MARSRRAAIDDDDSDDDIPVRRPPAKSGNGLAVIAAVVTTVLWVLLFLAVLIGGLLFLYSLKQATSAVQEASAGAMFSTVFIGLYVLARCVEKVAAALTRRADPR